MHVPIPKPLVSGDAWGATLEQRARAAVLATLALGIGCGPKDPDCHTAGQICTVAGSGQSGWNGDGELATLSWLYFPSGLDFDPEGRLVVVDYNNVRIRTLDAGRLRTTGGSGVHAWAEPGAHVLDSPMENPIDVAYAPDGTWYFAEEHSARIIRVQDDVISVYAGTGDEGFSGDGGPAVDAVLSEMTGLALGGDGELYIADTLNHCIRMVDPAGIIQDLGGYGLPGYAGDGGAVADALFNSPGRLAWADDQLYVADTGNSLIRRIDLENHTVSAFAGRGAPGYDGDGGPATEAALNRPTGVGVGPDGTVYIADTANHVVRRVGTDGVISTFAGTGEDALEVGTTEFVPATESALAGPADIAVDEHAVYVADEIGARVRRISLGE